MPKVRTKKKKWLKEQDEEEPEVFSVEQIKGKRIGAEGKVEYYLKWMNYPDSDNTWEPEDNLDCPELIEAYEKRMKGSHGGASSSSTVDATSNPVPRKGAEKEKKLKKYQVQRVPKSGAEKQKKDSKLSTSNSERNGANSKVDVPDPNDPSGFERGFEPEDILGATEMDGEILFLIKWKGIQDAELVYSSEANVKIPQMVIKFYESKLAWHDSPDLSNELEL